MFEVFMTGSLTPVSIPKFNSVTEFCSIITDVEFPGV